MKLALLSKPFGLLLMNKELLFIGAPVEFKTGVCIYPPKVSDVILN
jgi:hypothetical protein